MLFSRYRNLILASPQVCSLLHMKPQFQQARPVFSFLSETEVGRSVLPPLQLTTNVWLTLAHSQVAFTRRQKYFRVALVVGVGGFQTRACGCCFRLWIYVHTAGGHALCDNILRDKIRAVRQYSAVALRQGGSLFLKHRSLGEAVKTQHNRLVEASCTRPRVHTRTTTEAGKYAPVHLLLYWLTLSNSRGRKGR